MWYGSIQGSFTTSWKTVKSHVVDLSKIYFLIAENDPISMLVFKGKFCRKNKQLQSRSLQ